MSLVIFPRQFLVDINGTPRVGAKANFYQTGTTTPITTYTTSAYDVPNANPVLSVTSGHFPAIYINSDVNSTYKIVVTDSADVELYSEDNVPVESIYHRRTSAEITAGVTPTSYAYPPGDLRRYGCDVTGNTNNSTQIANALAAAVASGGIGHIYHPGGRIRHDSTITVPNGVTVFGHDRSKCVFEYVGTDSAWRNVNPVNSSGFGNVTFHRIKITTNSGSNIGAGIELNACGFSYYEVSECWINGSFKYGLILDGVEVSHFHHNIIENSGPANPINIWITNGDDRSVGQSHGYTNVLTINDNQISGAGGYGILDDGGNAHIIVNNNFNGHSVQIRGCALQSFVLQGNSFESLLQTGSANVWLTSIAGVSGATKGPCTNGIIQGNSFGGNMTAASACLRFLGDWHTGFTVSGNTFLPLFGRGSAIDCAFLANSYCGQNIDTGLSSMSHYNAITTGVRGNILYPPQSGTVVTDALYPYEFGDSRSALKPHGGLNFDTQGGLQFNGHILQHFTLEITNNAGTLQHRLVTSHIDAATAVPANLKQAIVGASATYQNTPTVSSGTGFGGVGVGITATHIYFDTAAQTPASNVSIASIEYYDGNNTRIRPSIAFDSINIGGTTRRRLAIQLSNDMTGATVAVDTTLIPSGKTLSVKVLACVMP